MFVYVCKNSNYTTNIIIRIKQLIQQKGIYSYGYLVSIVPNKGVDQFVYGWDV